METSSKGIAFLWFGSIKRHALDTIDSDSIGGDGIMGSSFVRR